MTAIIADELESHMDDFGTIYTVFDLVGTGYRAEVESFIRNGKERQALRVWPEERKRPIALPEIYCRVDWDNERYDFEIQTVSWGALKPEEIGAVIENYQTAAAVVDFLDQTFNA